MCVGSSNEAGWPLFTNKSKTNANDIIKIISAFKISVFDSLNFIDMNRNTAFYIISIVVIVSLYLFLEPKILPSLFNVRNSNLLNNFIANTVKEKRINTQEFWKMREFYCPGVFTYDKQKNPFLKYNCKWLKSEEFLVTYPTFNKKINLKNINILIENNQIQIYKDRQKLYINFIVTGSEMEKAVGVFHYREEDKDIIKNKFWLDTTVINL